MLGHKNLQQEIDPERCGVYAGRCPISLACHQNGCRERMCHRIAGLEGKIFARKAVLSLSWIRWSESGCYRKRTMNGMGGVVDSQLFLFCCFTVTHAVHLVCAYI